MRQTPLAKSPDWLKAAPMRENMRTSWRQSGQKQDHCPSLLNHNAKYKRLLPPCCDFANGVPFVTDGRPASRRPVHAAEDVSKSNIVIKVSATDMSHGFR